MVDILAAPRWVVVDIEGTVSPTAAVHVTLFGYARPRLDPLLRSRADQAVVDKAISDTKDEAGLADDASVDDVLAVLYAWMDDDRKASPLKTLQGLIWAEGFASGDLTPTFFPDAPPALRAWHAAGHRLAVYSSGSEQAQRDWFSHGADADLGELTHAYFDTVSAGPKREAASYARIANSLGAEPSDLLFLSDVVAELDAARTAGWQTIGLARPGEPQTPVWFGTHPRVTSFDEISLADPDLIDAGRTLSAASSRLAARGWMPATSGNLSTVLSRDPLRLVVTASGVDKETITAFDSVLVDSASRPLLAGRPGARPSAETELHAHIAEVVGAKAVVHVHAFASVLAGRRWPTGVDIAENELLKAIGRPPHEVITTLPVIANSQDMAVLAARLDAVRRDGVPGVIVADHGLYAWGDDLDQARVHTEALVWLCEWVLASNA